MGVRCRTLHLHIEKKDTGNLLNVNGPCPLLFTHLASSVFSLFQMIGKKCQTLDRDLQVPGRNPLKIPLPDNIPYLQLCFEGYVLAGCVGFELFGVFRQPSRVA